MNRPPNPVDRARAVCWRTAAALTNTSHTPLRSALRRPWPGTPRGLVLWLFSIALIILGAVNYALTALPASTRAALEFPLLIAPSTVWGWTMVGVGVLGLWSSYCHHSRDRWGYTLLAAFFFVWGMGYVTGWLIFGAPLRAVSGSAIWLLFSAIMIVCARFPRFTWADLRELERDGRVR